MPEPRPHRRPHRVRVKDYPVTVGPAPAAAETGCDEPARSVERYPVTVGAELVLLHPA